MKKVKRKSKKILIPKKINSEIEKVKQKGNDDLEIELVDKPVEKPVAEEKKEVKKDPADVTEEEKKKYSEDVQKRIKKVLAQKHEAEA